jgi:protein-L-isoaspartate(D-aspartate) O-methyltransferase
MLSSSDEVLDNVGFQAARAEMVSRQLRRRGIASPRVLEAIERVPRHFFVSADLQNRAYADEPLPIGAGQTISQPYMVAAMAESLALTGDERVLEIGAGSGYLAAILSLLAREVVAIESLASLADAARERLARLGFANVNFVIADGSVGYPEDAPYDGIVVSAAAPSVPAPLVEQLAEGGRLLIPVGDSENQTLVRVVKRDGRVEHEPLFACRFVPLLGRHGWGGSRQFIPVK